MALTSKRQDFYLQRIDQHIESLLENLSNLISNSKINDKTATSREEFHLALHSNNIVHSAQALQQIISELKISTLLHDFPTMQAELGLEQETCRTNMEKTQKTLTRIQQEIRASLNELEEHYDASQCRTTT
eukprot:GILJ01010900.1.p1 GENE.GILJ01010900.1~~GILJ01010900.1.p1  ORF type:complete len:131 (+),score=7.42 GILJ01010900.1:51-443(+)